VQLEGLGQLKKIHLIGNGTRDLPVCSIVPQPTTVPVPPDVIQAFSENVAAAVERFREICYDLVYCRCREDVNLFRFQLSRYMKWRDIHLCITDERRSITQYENPNSTIFKQ
jgi:hypothetical protein